MQFKTTKEELFEVLGVVMGAVGVRPTLPILSNILLETIGGSELRITTTNLELSIRTSCPAYIVEEGTVTIPAKKLYDIIRELGGGELEVVVGKNFTVNIKTKHSFFKIMGLESSDFPKFPEHAPEQSFQLKQKVFRKCLTLTAFAVSRDEARYTLNGVLIVVKNGAIRFVATDGKRLASIEKGVDLPKELSFEAIIPAKTIAELIKSLISEKDNLQIIRARNQIIFKINKTLIASRLIEGQFPNFEQVIPKGEKTKTQIARDILLQAIKRVAVLTSPENQSVKLDFIKGRLLVSSRSPNLGEAKEEIEVDVSGEDLSIGFNPTYLIDVLKNLNEDEVSLSLTDPDKPGLIQNGDGYQYVVMPMQLT
jgi:DNA polymerase III subunit beta